jgi:hypothetical protein
MNKSELRKDIENVINCHSAENGSDTPDFILAEYLMGCLETFDKAVNARGKFYGHHLSCQICHSQIGYCVHKIVEEPDRDR